MELELQQVNSENEHDRIGISTEDFANRIAIFCTYESNLVSDKGVIKLEDIFAFTHECSRLMWNYTNFEFLRN